MRIIKARYRTTAEFLAAYQKESLFGGIFFPTREIMAAGDPVIIEFRFPGLLDRVLIRGTVAWRRAGKLKDGTRAGLGIDFLPVERHKRDFLLSVARGEAEIARPVVQRNHRRLPTSVPIGWHVKSERERFPAMLDDIGPGGAFIRTTNAVEVGTPVVVELVPPGAAAPFLIEARVAWSRVAPGEEGLGVEFRCRDTGGLRRLKELVRRLEQLEPSAA